MADTVTNELLYEVLKKMQADISHIRARVDDHDQQFISVREELHHLDGALHTVKGDVLRVEKHLVATGQRLERIETRLNLIDA